MEFVLKELAHAVASICETLSITILLVAAVTAAGRLVWHWRGYSDMNLKKEIWLHFAASLVLALEFALAADIADTAIAPDWDQLGQLAAIAAIRTFLNLFLERDIEALTKAREEARLEAEA
jgi:uncharacterized membrane protein